MPMKLEDNTEIRDGVFKIIGEHPKYRVQLCEDLLGYTNLTADDVKVVSFHKESGYGMENDVGLLCRDETLMLQEANTEAPYNMPIRMFLYAAVIYRIYIMNQDKNIRKETDFKLPGLQAYVVYPHNSDLYTGSLYLRDYMTKPNSLDLEVKVLNKGHEGSKVIKDYISVCDLVAEGRKKGLTDVALGMWVRQQCLKLGLFVDIMQDPNSGMLKELSLMATVRDIREAGRAEGMLEEREQMFSYFAKKYGISEERLRKDFAEDMLGSGQSTGYKYSSDSSIGRMDLK